jgi:type II secretory pathway predicted ATPase ExeA
MGSGVATASWCSPTVLVDFGVMSQADRSVGRLAEASRADLLAALRDFSVLSRPLQAFAVVIIDEAQSLSTELLDDIRVLSETGGYEQLLQVMLVGQPSLMGNRAKPALRTLFRRVSARATLGPLQPDDVAGYVAHRLQVAGESLVQPGRPILRRAQCCVTFFPISAAHG